MILESILNKFLPSTISLKSVENLASNIEKIGKISAGLLALLYIVGLIIFGLYQNAQHIRSIELFKVRYLLVGFYYLAFLFLHLVFPQWWIKRLWTKIIYWLVLLVIIIFLNNANHTYLTYLINKSNSGTSYFRFKPGDISILNGDLILLVMMFLSVPWVFGYSIRLAKLAHSRGEQQITILFVLFSFIYNCNIFTMFIFPYIPDAIGGGQAPIVHIVFDKDVPYEVTTRFDMEGKVLGYSTPWYYGKLVYMDNNSVFLQEPYWYSHNVYEIRRDNIIVLQYTDFNPAEIGYPGLFP